MAAARRVFEAEDDSLLGSLAQQRHSRPDRLDRLLPLASPAAPAAAAPAPVAAPGATATRGDAFFEDIARRLSELGSALHSPPPPAGAAAAAAAATPLWRAQARAWAGGVQEAAPALSPLPLYAPAAAATQYARDAERATSALQTPLYDRGAAAAAATKTTQYARDAERAPGALQTPLYDRGGALAAAATPYAATAGPALSPLPPCAPAAATYATTAAPPLPLHATAATSSSSSSVDEAVREALRCLRGGDEAAAGAALRAALERAVQPLAERIAVLELRTASTAPAALTKLRGDASPMLGDGVKLIREKSAGVAFSVALDPQQQQQQQRLQQQQHRRHRAAAVPDQREEAAQQQQQQHVRRPRDDRRATVAAASMAQYTARRQPPAAPPAAPAAAVKTPRAAPAKAGTAAPRQRVGAAALSPIAGTDLEDEADEDMFFLLPPRCFSGEQQVQVDAALARLLALVQSPQIPVPSRGGRSPLAKLCAPGEPDYAACAHLVRLQSCAHVRYVCDKVVRLQRAAGVQELLREAQGAAPRLLFHAPTDEQLDREMSGLPDPAEPEPMLLGSTLAVVDSIACDDDAADARAGFVRRVVVRLVRPRAWPRFAGTPEEFEARHASVFERLRRAGRGGVVVAGSAGDPHLRQFCYSLGGSAACVACYYIEYRAFFVDSAAAAAVAVTPKQQQQQQQQQQQRQSVAWSRQ
eukprot:m51a1_g5860 hypothetical protein (701) ;mRNA; f:381443-383976